MYIPPHNRETDFEQIVAFMRAYSFATLVTARDHFPKATHLPFVVEADADVRLIAHMAKANDQWRDFADGENVLVIFQEPHAYISPRHYEQPLSVPTWNYVAVHAYGYVKLFDAREEKLRALKKLIAHTDSDYLQRLDALPAEFVAGKLKGIVAFEVVVGELQGRFKLSQDRTHTEQETIIRALSDDGDSVRATIGEMMRQRAAR